MTVNGPSTKYLGVNVVAGAVVVVLVVTEPTGHPRQDILLGLLPPPRRWAAALALLWLRRRVVHHQLLQPLDALRVHHPLHRLEPLFLHILRLGSAPAAPQKALVGRNIVKALDIWKRNLHGGRVQGQKRVKLIRADIYLICVIVPGCTACLLSTLRYWWRTGTGWSCRFFTVWFDTFSFPLLHVWNSRRWAHGEARDSGKVLSPVEDEVSLRTNLKTP